MISALTITSALRWRLTCLISQLLDLVFENDYIFLSLACCVIVVVPIFFCYALAWTKTLFTAFAI
jgi:hypothetical protein